MRKQLFVLFMAFFAVNFSAQNILTSPFTLGFLGDASANNAATNCVYIQNVGVSKVQFIQNSPQTIYVSQGNDIPGEVKLTDATGVDYVIPGFIKWRAPSGNNPSTMIFKPNVGVNQDVVIYNNGQNQVYNISPAKYIGLTFSGQTLNIVGGQVTGNSASMLNILNNYVSTLAKLVVSNLSVVEEVGNANVIVTRTGNLNQTVTVDYSFTNGTAVNGSDYSGQKGTLTIASGATTGSIVVPIIDNSMYELTEDFNVILNNPNNASITGGTAVVSITDGDSMVYGCMDTTACNFNPCVFQDNGTCVYPTQEQCNGIDDDCDGNIDNGFALNTFYTDQDGDQYGDSNSPVLACAQGPGMVVNGGDCDDNNALVHPGLVEICNGIDDDCDGIVDNGFDLDGDQWTTCEGDCNDNDPSINPGVLEGPFQEGSCDFIDNNCDGVVDEYWDQDQDGYTVCEGDCDDFNELIHPGVAELCNNIDDNCNNQVDENLTQYPVYADADGDGYGVATGETSCTESTITPGDCDDNNEVINPSATELCNNIDDNCNNQVDENLTQYPVYTDADGDGYGVATGTTSCSPSTILPGDCNDTNNAINPGATELCNNIDDNCNTQVDENLTQYPVYTDADGDGYGVATGATSCTPSTILPGDCNDTNSTINPSATELCNNIDDNCNNQIDENLTQYTVYTDADGDGYGAATGETSCTESTITPGDCNDTDSAIKPSAVETCNNIDDNCNNQVDENLTQYPVYTDADGDGYGVATGTTSCSPSTILPGDCNDTNSAIKPNATELCNNIDDNCNNQVDENLTQYPVYTDADGDGYGVATGTTSCSPSTILPGDCNDTNSAIKPNATELCNNIDDNCNNQVDENLTQYPVYTDADGDGYGVATGTTSCSPSTILPGDCNDTNSAIKPNATELCNNIDDNCNNQVDENLTQYPVYTDADGDGYGAATGETSCTESTITPGDCDDDNEAINPSATEFCNNIDDNCNNQVDENLTQYPVYTDADGDGYGVATGTTSCSPSTILPGDCNDTNSAIKPNATELCNSIDDNCNNQVDENLPQYPVYTDADGDGYGVATGATSCTPSTILPGDCNDTNSAIKPNATELCNNIDDNCNNQVDENLTQYPVYTDADGDGYGVATGTTSCSPSTILPGDCNDTNSAIKPNATELCNNIDDNCNNQVDENLTQYPVYTDADGDGYGVATGATSCTPSTILPGDCNDTNSAINPSATESCNNIDDNCNNQVDENLPQYPVYTDADGDGYGVATGETSCTESTITPGDCDDNNEAINPSATELCNNIDDNCNNQVDENLTQYPVYADADGDGYGLATGETSCTESTITPGDCDDNNEVINPSATELCNNIDDNCNNQVDENLTQYPVYTDADGDGYGVATGETSCTPSTILPGDCNDTNSAINPSATESCNNIDDNCNNQVDEGLVIGCTDFTAFNYDNLATCDDGSCIARVYGCTNELACNYDSQANTDDSSCVTLTVVSDTNNVCSTQPLVLSAIVTGLQSNPNTNMNGPIPGFAGPFFFENSSYYISTQSTNWAMANAEAQAMGGQLAVINSNDELNYIKNLIGQNGVSPWIGLTQNTSAPDFSEPAGGWYWSNGVPFAFNWDVEFDTEPNNCIACCGSVEDAAQFYSNGTFNDLCINSNTRYLVEFNQSASYSITWSNGMQGNEITISNNGTTTYTATLTWPGGQCSDDITITTTPSNAYYTDADGDGYGDINAVAVEACTAPTGSVDNNDDCDDNNALVNPAQTEVCNDVDDNCNGQVDEGLTFVDYYTDSDLDGYGTTPVLNYCLNPGLGYTTTSGDCDDLNPNINPGEIELCNNIDDNCNNQVDENLTQYPVYTDADGDGYGVATGETSCTESTITPGDCDDNNEVINPSATELCNNIDDNCNNQIDENLTQYPVYTDADGDGYGIATGETSCTESTITPGDCDDNNEVINPSATELCNNIDDNCNNQVDENLTQYPVYTDADGDGYGVATGETSCTESTITPGDCDDNNEAINPVAAEICNDVDDNCDGTIDEGVKTMYYTDADGDGYGDINAVAVEACTAPTGSVDNNDDCDDNNALVNPAQTEVCNDVDDNCNGQVDEGLTFVDYYTDSDLDGYGTTPVLNYCLNPGLGYTTTSGDCDDLNPNINPGEIELCNNIDDNCNNQVDENLTQYPVYTDADGDGYGVATGETSCTESTITPGDCDDNNEAINPVAAEICNDVDDNCNNQVDENLTQYPVYADADGDGYGVATGETSCTESTITPGDCDDNNQVINPSAIELCNNIDDNCNNQVDENLTQYPVYTDADGDGYGVATGEASCTESTITPGDCDDNNEAINPSATESCNNIDDNCNNQVDENLTQYPVYTDADGDGYGVATGETSCTESTITPGDCDDNNEAINPVAAEICNDVDDNCDGTIDEGVKTMYYTDADGDGYGDINAVAVEACTAPTGSVDNNDDCDDNNALVNPAQTEVCNDVDDNCNGQVDEGLTFVDYYTDSDLDGYGTTPVLNYCLNPGLGYTTTSGDCDDLNPNINPGEIELCNNIDDNCNNQVDENLTQYPVYTDADGDGYGVATGETSCTESTITLGDCDDNNEVINPSATELCNNIDDNCNNQIDENLTQYPVYTDADGDGYGVATGETSCTESTITPGDCDDNNEAINPSATEICNDVDDNCDGTIDEGVKTMYYTDADGDGYGDINAVAVEACTAPTGSVDNNDDCDDNNALVNPAQTEVCNDVDDNCNNQVDENLTQYPVYTDADGDGYGVATGETSCTESTITPGDCDDNNEAINPSATELCNNIDDNCNNQVDENLTQYPVYTDADGDGYGVATGETSCTESTITPGDCDDNNEAINPSATESCNNIDDNCNNQVDENLTQYPVYTDADGDGYGVATGETSCTESTITPGDCDDNNEAINPVAAEICNDVDDNCDGTIDEGVKTMYYTDADGDGYGDVNALAVEACTAPTGSVDNNGDCDDNNEAINPAATEICDNGFDDNCDGLAVQGCVLGCMDNTACNYNPEATGDDGSCIYPQTEICNAIDDDCDGQINEGFSIESLNATTVNTAYFPACTPTNIFSANPFLGVNTATIDGDGKDRWYKWNAQYNSLRIGLSAAIGDYSIHLYREYPNCLALEMIEHEVTTGNQTLITDELSVGANYYFAVHEHAGPGNTSAKLCINHFLPSDCDHYYSNGTGEYATVCGSFKTLYRGNANNYMINVLSAAQNGQSLGIQPWVYQAGSSSVIPRLGSILPSNLTSSPVVYTVNVPVMYSIPDAAENYTPVFAQATSTCTITLLPQTPIQVRASDRCPNIKAINSYIAPDQTICGSSAYQWEFTDCTNGLSVATTQVLTGANGSSIFMLNNIPGVAPGKFYQVRVRPVHGSGVVSQWGPVQCVMIQGSGMIVQEDNTSAVKISTDLNNMTVYPNPSTSGDLNVLFEKPLEGQLNIEITNLLGQEIYTETLDFSGLAHKLDISKLAKGIFQMTVRINGMEHTARIVRD